MAQTITIFARADWNATKIQEGDIAPFTGVTGLEFGHTAFNSADAMFAYAAEHYSETEDGRALFATHSTSYGIINDHEDFTISTVKYGDYETAKFARCLIDNEHHDELSYDTFTFSDAAVEFLYNGVDNTFDVGLYAHGVITNNSNVTVNGKTHINNHGDLWVEGGSQFTTVSFSADYGSNIKVEDSTFNASSISVNNGASFTAKRATLNTTGDVTIGGSADAPAFFSLEDSTFNATSITTQTLYGTITMNSSSLIIAESISLPNWGSNTSLEVDVSKSTGSFASKVLSLTTPIASDVLQNKVKVTGGTGTVKPVIVQDATGNPIRYEYWATNMGDDLPDTKDKVYVNSTWPSGTLPTGAIYGFNAFDKVADAVNEAPLPIFVVGGTYDTSNAPTFDGIETTIEAGTFTTSVCGGKVFDAGGKVSGDINFSIAGGTFSKLVFAGDRVNGGVQQTRTGNLTTTITNGEFNSAVGGAMLVTGLTTPSLLTGNVELTIKGGTFNSSSWIYGGGVATKKIYGGQTTINGNVTVTLDATNNAITVSNLVVGSYGYGSIKENATLVLTGNYNINATGEIWGGCSGDFITIRDGKRVMEESKVDGKRILSFTGFSGTLASGLNKIRAFSDIEFKNGSEAKLGGCINLSDTTNWSFESGSSLTGDFINDFEGDTLNLTGFSETGTFNLMFDSDTSTNDIFKGFEALGEIQLNGVTQSKTYSSTDTTMTWALSGGGSVVVDKAAGTMSFIA